MPFLGRNLAKIAFLLTWFPLSTGRFLQADEPGRKGVVSAGFIFQQAPYRSCHSATIAEIAPGKLVAAWFGGTAERNPDVCIYVAKFEKGVWHEPKVVADGKQTEGVRLPTWNPVLFHAPDGVLHLFYKIGPSPSKWWGMLIRSTDGGTTWSPPTRLGQNRIGPVKNKPIVLGDGTWLAPSSREDQGWTVHIERSEDGGQNWTTSNPLNDGRMVLAIQPTLLQHNSGVIQLLARGREDKIMESWSSDGGQTWSGLIKAALPNNNSGIDAVQMKNGYSLLVYNHSTREQPGMGHKGRGILNVAVSRDGRTWNAALVLDYLDEPGRQFSYPSVIQTSDGLVHIVYTWHREKIKHVIVDPEALSTLPIHNGQWPPQVDSGHKIDWK